MNCFTGIVPPDPIYNTVLAIQTPFGDNRLEPHITLNPPRTVVAMDEWIAAAEDLCNGTTPFTIELPGTGQFGQRVLFIDVRSAALAPLHYLLEDALKPFEKIGDKVEDGHSFNPHLTLGRKWCGFSKEGFTQMKVLAEEYLSKNPVSFTVNSIRLYHKPKPGGRYEKIKDVMFNG